LHPSFAAPHLHLYSIGNLVHANFAGHFFGIPLKSFGGGEDAYTEEELYDTLAVLFAYVFLDSDTASSFERGAKAAKHTKRLGEVMKGAVAAVKNERFVALKHMIGLDSSEAYLKDYGASLINRLFEGGKSVDEVVWTIISTAAAAAATQAQGVCAPYVTLNTRGC
jgi:hypothetical protein